MNKLSFNILISLIIITFLFSMGCNIVKDDIIDSNQHDEKLDEGLCIYPTEVQFTSDLSYQEINVDDASLIGEPTIFYDDIISYDTTAHILSLSYPRDSLKITVKNVYGEPFLVALDSEKIYGGWFWTPASSIPCHWVVIEPDALFDSLATNEIRIKLGYPNENHFQGVDPRNSRKIFDRLAKDGKTK